MGSSTVEKREALLQQCGNRAGPGSDPVPPGLRVLVVGVAEDVPAGGPH